MYEYSIQSAISCISPNDNKTQALGQKSPALVTPGLAKYRSWIERLPPLHLKKLRPWKTSQKNTEYQYSICNKIHIQYSKYIWVLVKLPNQIKILKYSKLQNFQKFMPLPRVESRLLLGIVTGTKCSLPSSFSLVKKAVPRLSVSSTICLSWENSSHLTSLPLYEGLLKWNV